jgi:putative MATE family efflux protein
VGGAAGATILSQGIAVLVGFLLLKRGVRGIRLKAIHLRPKSAALRKLTTIGLPAAAGQSGSALGFNVLQGIVNSLGTPVIAAFGIGNRIINLFMLPAMGMAQAATVMIGEKLGARKKDEVRLVLRQAVLTVFIFISLGMTYTFFRGDLFIKFFLKDPEVEALGTNLFRIVSPSVILFSLFTVVTAAFQGSGDTRPIMTLNILRLWGIRVPLAWILVVLLGVGPTGIWISMFVSNLGVAILGFILLAKRPWMDHLKP